MKKILLAAFALLALMFESCSGCKEVGPAVNLTAPKTGSYDSLITLSSADAAALTADAHNVLVEEYTGQGCNNCPSAHSQLDALAEATPGRINAIGLYIYGPPQGLPPSGSIHDFRDSASTKVSNVIYGGVGSLPSGGVDRLPGTPPPIDLVRTDWSGHIATQLTIADSINLSLTSNYNTATNTAQIIATITYVYPVSGKQSLNVAILEDGMVDKQEFPDGVHDVYRFTNVFRDMVSSVPSGDPILDSMTTKKRGTVLKRSYSYKLKTTTPSIIPDSCHIVAFISNGSGAARIYQSTQAKLK